MAQPHRRAVSCASTTASGERRGWGAVGRAPRSPSALSATSPVMDMRTHRRTFRGINNISVGDKLAAHCTCILARF